MRQEDIDALLERTGSATPTHVDEGFDTREVLDALVEDDFADLAEGTRAEQFRCKAIFSGGGSGSGKGFVLKNTVGGLGLITLNMDDTLERLADSPLTRELLQQKRTARGAAGDITGKGYSRRGAKLDLGVELMKPFVQKELRPYAKKKYKSKYEMVIAQRRGLVFDVTGGNVETIKKLHKLLTAHGYDCGMMFVRVKTPTAIKRDKKRKRTLGAEKVTEIHDEVNAAVPQLRSIFGPGNFLIVRNEDIPGMEEAPKGGKKGLPEAARVRSGATMMRDVKGRKAQQRATTGHDPATRNKMRIKKAFDISRKWTARWLKKPVQNPVGKAYLASLKEAVAADAGMIEKTSMYVVYRKDATGYIYEQMFYDPSVARDFARRMKGAVVVDPAQVPDRVGRLSQLGGKVLGEAAGQPLDEFFGKWKRDKGGKFASKGGGQQPAPRKKVRLNIANDEYAKALAQVEKEKSAAKAPKRHDAEKTGREAQKLVRSDPRHKDVRKVKAGESTTGDRTGVELTEPAGLVKPGQEGEWKRAKAAAHEQYPGLEGKDKDRFYSIVTTIFKSMTGGKKNEAAESKRVGELLVERMTGIRG